MAVKVQNSFKCFSVSGIYAYVRPWENLFAAVFLTIALSAEAATTEARLILSAETARPGDTVMAGVQLKMSPGWHTYWRNPGGPGIATSINWQLPPGVSAGGIQWPLPEKLTASNETSYAYSKEVVLPMLLKLAPDLKPGKLELKGEVSWLECKTICVRGNASVSAKLQLGDETKPSPDAGLIESWIGKVPQAAPASSVKLSWEQVISSDSRPLLIEWSIVSNGKPADFLPYADDAFEVSPATEVISLEPDKVRLRKVVKKTEGSWPKQIAGVLSIGTGESALGYEVNLPVAESSVGEVAVQAQTQSLWRMLLYAFIGGLILNIMPCVLPVIALKILGFVSQAKDHPRQVRKLGLIYAAGVLVSFLALAVGVLVIKAGGHKAGWGMQFSNPQFIVALTVLVTLVALNLFGVFEVTLNGRVMGAAGNLASKHGASGAFFNGVLATILATPCTAPFLGAALGFAFVQSAAIILLMFLTIGVGLAAPYVVLSWQPAWLRFLPKPGAWMENFKIAMGFPMLGTSVWLFSLTTTFYGERSWWLGVFLVFVGASAWIFGAFVQRGRARRPLAVLFVLLLLAVGYGWALDSKLRWRSPDAGSKGENVLRHAPEGYAWQRWSAEAVVKARAEGRPVVVDFTAKWCLTCNITVKPAFETKRVINKLKEINAAALLADYTLYPPDIGEELARFDRAGVPLVLVYPRDASKAPLVLPEPLSPSSSHYSGVILDALDNATK